MFARAKKLCEYAFVVTKKAPKEFRWNIIDKILNGILELLQVLYIAYGESGVARVANQRAADAKLKVIGYLGILAKDVGAFTNKNLEAYAVHVFETRQSLWRWIKSK